MPVLINDDSPDCEVWPHILAGDAPTFAIIVRRYQSLVCAVAYNACGNLAQSEDVAQETFWAAWRERNSLKDIGRLREWLCGIARNLGMNALRRSSRPVEATSSLSVASDTAVDDSDPAESAVTKEEESLVWQSLSEIPELYREPLILFYREQQSISEVANALELNPDVVKQRLSRGRSMLRERVTDLVEGALRRSRPGRPLTIAVMAGLTAVSTGSKTAMAGTAMTGMSATGVKSVVAAGLIKGSLAGLFGSLFGLAGGWFGTWLPAQLAPSKSERELIQRVGRRMLIVLSVLTIVPIGVAFTLPLNVIPMVVVWPIFFGSVWAYVLVETILMTWQIKLIRLQTNEPNDTYLRTSVNSLSNRFCGRVYRSKSTCLGWPLIDINVSDPTPGDGMGLSQSVDKPIRTAKGWIAVGDNARGILFALGTNTASGLIAFGGRCLGALSVGGVAVGLIAFGGLGFGAVSVGGLSVGGLAIGGLAVGWQSSGGFAVAADVACGGGAVAWRAAYGGFAAASQYAVGGEAHAKHANDELAKSILLEHPLKLGMDWYASHVMLFNIVLVVAVLLLPLLSGLLMYRVASNSEKVLK